MKGNNCAICNKLIDYRSKLCHRCSAFKRYNENSDKSNLPENKIIYRERKKSPYSENGKKIYRLRRNFLLNLLGDKCNNCGITEKRILQFDHINGGGKREGREFKTKVNMYRYYFDNPDIALKNLQILCGNCNVIKRIENKEYRSKGEGNYRKKVRLEIFSNIGNKCQICGNSDLRILQFGHKEGSILQELEYFKHTTSIYYYYRNNPEVAKQKLIPLCPNCNILSHN